MIGQYLLNKNENAIMPPDAKFLKTKQNPSEVSTLYTTLVHPLANPWYVGPRRTLTTPLVKLRLTAAPARGPTRR